MIAPGRARRPGAERPAVERSGEEDLATCPFCEGREAETPPETFALAPPGRAPDSPGWQVRVVPNKFPAFSIGASAEGGRAGFLEARPARGNQEVVVHTPRHVRSLAELTDEELERVATAWRVRAAAARVEGFPYVQALVNEGRAAGASLPHSHSQLVWLPEEPPLVAHERALQDKAQHCVVCRTLAAEREHGTRLVLQREGLVLLCPFASRQPYELLAVPVECEPDPLASGLLAAALQLVAEGLRRLHAVEGSVAVNLWLHPGRHWHAEILPRSSVLAGLELGAGYYLNTLAPEEAATALRMR